MIDSVKEQKDIQDESVSIGHQIASKRSSQIEPSIILQQKREKENYTKDPEETKI